MEETRSASSSSKVAPLPVEGEGAGEPKAGKKKKRCDFNPSIWFQVPNVVKGISIFGGVVIY